METQDAVGLQVDTDVQGWIDEGRDGSADAQGRLFERCRNYLLLVAEHQLDRGLRGKLGASDLVQETFLRAGRGFDRFRGTSEEELLGWLQRILQNEAGQAVRRFRRAAKRDIRREKPLSPCDSRPGGGELPGHTETPSRLLAAAEELDRLAAALARLPKHYQCVIQWRNTERKSFDEIGKTLDRSPDAARKLWVRAIEQLRGELEAADSIDPSRGRR